MNRRLKVLLISLFITFTWQTAFADSPLVQYSGNGHSYQRIDTPSTWSNARTYCESLGGYLATLTSQQENDFVYQNLALQQVDIWLGGTDEISEGNWQWVTGEPWSYTNWFPGNPDNNASAGQDYLAFTSFDTLGRWDDAGLPSEDLSRLFICEWDGNLKPESVPTMTGWGMIILSVLLGTGSVYYLKRRRPAI